MAGLKVTLDAALRARDVSRPTAAQEAAAERALPGRLAWRVEAADHAAESPESLTASQQARRGPGRRPPRPGGGKFGDRRPRDRRADVPWTDGTADDAARDPGESAGAPGARDREAGESAGPPPGGRPRTRRRYRLGRLAGLGGPEGSAGHSPGPPADHGSGGSSPDVS